MRRRGIAARSKRLPLEASHHASLDHSKRRVDAKGLRFIAPRRPFDTSALIGVTRMGIASLSRHKSAFRVTKSHSKVTESRLDFSQVAAFAAFFQNFVTL